MHVAPYIASTTSLSPIAKLNCLSLELRVPKRPIFPCFETMTRYSTNPFSELTAPPKFLRKSPGGRSNPTAFAGPPGQVRAPLNCLPSFQQVMVRALTTPLKTQTVAPMTLLPLGAVSSSENFMAPSRSMPRSSVLNLLSHFFSSGGFSSLGFSREKWGMGSGRLALRWSMLPMGEGISGSGWGSGSGQQSYMTSYFFSLPSFRSTQFLPLRVQILFSFSLIRALSFFVQSQTFLTFISCASIFLKYSSCSFLSSCFQRLRMAHSCSLISVGSINGQSGFFIEGWKSLFNYLNLVQSSIWQACCFLYSISCWRSLNDIWRSLALSWSSSRLQSSTVAFSWTLSTPSCSSLSCMCLTLLSERISSLLVSISSLLYLMVFSRSSSLCWASSPESSTLSLASTFLQCSIWLYALRSQFLRCSSLCSVELGTFFLTLFLSILVDSSSEISLSYCRSQSLRLDS